MSQDWRDREIDRLENALGYSEEQSLIEMDRGYERESRAEERLYNLLSVAEEAVEILDQLVSHPSAADVRDRLEIAIAMAREER